MNSEDVMTTEKSWKYRAYEMKRETVTTTKSYHSYVNIAVKYPISSNLISDIHFFLFLTVTIRYTAYPILISVEKIDMLHATHSAIEHVVSLITSNDISKKQFRPEN